jgi:hypothetical protein
VPGNESRKAKTIGACILTRYAHNVAATTTIVKKGANRLRQIGVHGLIAGSLTSQQQITPKYRTVLANIFYRYRLVKWAAFGKTDERGYIETQRHFLRGRKRRFADYAR